MTYLFFIPIGLVMLIAISVMQDLKERPGYQINLLRETNKNNNISNLKEIPNSNEPKT